MITCLDEQHLPPRERVSAIEAHPPTNPLPESVAFEKTLPTGGAASQTTTGEHVYKVARPKRKVLIPKRSFKDAIRAKCLECVGYVPHENKDCHKFEGYHNECNLAPVRTRRMQRAATMRQLKKVIKSECQLCLNGHPLWVCSSPGCPLYPVFVKPVHDERGWFDAHDRDG